MDDNLPNNPLAPQSSAPDEVGSNPIDPNNPYSPLPQPNPVPPLPQTPTPNIPPVVSETEPENPDVIKHEHYSEVAQNKPRDEHGHFIHTNPTPQTPPNPPNTPNPPSFLPPIIEINQNTKPTEKEDPPLFGFFLTNPVTYLKKFLSKLLKRQMITLRIPVLALIVVMVGIGGFGVGFQSGLNYAVGKLFPNFSPILHRSITAQGTIQKSTKGYYLQANDKNKTMWSLMPKSQNVNLADFENMKVEVKGNMTPTPNLIEVSEVISFETKPTPAPTIPATVPPNPPNIPNSPNLPNLYSGLTWEVTQSKTLIFTSGKRKIEQEGVYLESALTPQDFSGEAANLFINYYIGQLTNSGFKQTFNSSDPNGTTITYAKDDLFLTFGIKNIYSGSGDNKKLVGYKAFIEHN